MAKVSAKRQITIPIDLCLQADIHPGDEVDTYIYNGQITIVKKEIDAARGMLRHIKADKRFSDEQSLQSAIEEKYKGKK